LEEFAAGLASWSKTTYYLALQCYRMVNFIGEKCCILQSMSTAESWVEVIGQCRDLNGKELKSMPKAANIINFTKLHLIEHNFLLS
jgi:hypothetical protein